MKKRIEVEKNLLIAELLPKVPHRIISNEYYFFCDEEKFQFSRRGLKKVRMVGYFKLVKFKVSHEKGKYIAELVLSEHPNF